MIKSSVAQDNGKKSINNDDYLIDGKLGLYILCDGSSDIYGRWIAEAAKNLIQKKLLSHAELIESYNKSPSFKLRNQISEQIDAAIQYAANEVVELKNKGPEKALSFTTLDILLVLKDSFLIAHIGNSRIYLIREEKFKVLTDDDTYYNAKIREGFPVDTLREDDKKHLTKVFGNDRVIPVKIQAYSLLLKDIFIMCTDGFFLSFTDHKTFCQTLLELQKKGQSLDATAKALMSASVKNEADDNSSILLVLNDSIADQKDIGTAEIVKKQIELVRDFRMFRGIRDNDSYLLQAHGLFSFVTVKKGVSIITQGDESNSLFIILKGHANVLVDGVPRNEAKAGDAIGEYGIFTQEKRSATVIATEEMQLISVTKTDLDAFCNKNNEFAYLLMKGVLHEVLNKAKSDEQKLLHPETRKV